MPLRQPKVHDVNAARLATQDEVAGLDIAVDEAALVHLPDGGEHLHQDVNRDFE